jgi:TusA-related sulfurtransferase
MSDTALEADETVDARGATCPGPLMDLIGAVRGAETGTVIRLLSDNDQSLTDVPAWADESGNDVLTTEEADDYYEIYVETA